MIIQFVARLAGPLRHDFAIEHVATVSFDPQGFLVQVAKLCVCVMKHGLATPVWTALCNDVEYNQTIATSFVDLVLARHQHIQTMLLTETEKSLFATLPGAVAAVKAAISARSQVKSIKSSTITSVSDTAVVAGLANSTPAKVAPVFVGPSYETVMQPLLIGEAMFRISDDNPGFLHAFRSNISESHGARNKIKVIKREVDVSLSSYHISGHI